MSLDKNKSMIILYTKQMVAPPFSLKCTECGYVNVEEPCNMGEKCPKCKKGTMEERKLD